MHMPYWGYDMSFGMIFSTFIFLVIAIGIILLIWWMVSNQMKSKEKSALDILKKRYANSEISKKEFEEKKKDLA